MDKPIVARYTLDSADIRSALLAHARGPRTRQGRLLITLVYFMAIVVTIGLLGLVFNGSTRSEDHLAADKVKAISVILMIWLAIIFSRPLIRWMIKFPMKRTADARKSVNCDIRDDDMTISGQEAESTIRWSHWTMIIESAHCFLLYSTPDIFHILPTRAFDQMDSMRRFAALARERVKNYLVLENCRYPEKLGPIESIKP